MNWRSIFTASIVDLVTLATWWIGILALDGALSMILSYDQYQLAALLYPEVYYPALPGWILAHSQPTAIGVWLVALGWMLTLSVAIGAAAVRYPVVRSSSPTVTAAVFVVALFVAVAVLEAAATLLA